MRLDHDDRRRPNLHARHRIPDGPKQAVTPIGLGASDSGKVEEAAKVAAMPLLFQNEQPNRLDKIRVSNGVRIVSCCGEQVRPVGCLTKLPAAK